MSVELTAQMKVMNLSYVVPFLFITYERFTTFIRAVSSTLIGKFMLTCDAARAAHTYVCSGAPAGCCSGSGHR
jgi:hypothetical protein